MKWKGKNEKANEHVRNSLRAEAVALVCRVNGVNETVLVTWVTVYERSQAFWSQYYKRKLAPFIMSA